MKGIRLLALTCLASGMPLMSTAAEEVRYNFECDTPAAHFSYWKRTVSSSEIEISGKVAMRVLREDEKFIPIANIVLRKGKERTGRFGIRFFVSAKSPDRISVELLKVGGHDAIGTGSLPNNKKPIPFSLRLDSSGMLKATVAGSEASTMIGPFEPETFELSCSTSEINFTDVTVIEKASTTR